MLPPVFTSVLLLWSSIFGNQTESDKMVKMFSEGNSESISAYFNSSIQLTTPGKEGVYSRSQAKMILSDFFSANAPTQATLKTKGNSENGAQFVLLNLITSEGTFKVNIFYRGSGNNVKIHELKIEK
ncbi:MAG: DUF4783 domain-containing protein [Bacteroidetes bacterium]|nr:DUF4783 domain-containing protein [Bacteroidota bacterium]